MRAVSTAGCAAPADHGRVENVAARVRFARVLLEAEAQRRRRAARCSLAARAICLRTGVAGAGRPVVGRYGRRLWSGGRARAAWRDPRAHRAARGAAPGVRRRSGELRREIGTLLRHGEQVLAEIAGQGTRCGRRSARSTASSRGWWRAPAMVEQRRGQAARVLADLASLSRGTTSIPSCGRGCMRSARCCSRSCASADAASAALARQHDRAGRAAAMAGRAGCRSCAPRLSGCARGATTCGAARERLQDCAGWRRAPRPVALERGAGSPDARGRGAHRARAEPGAGTGAGAAAAGAAGRRRRRSRPGRPPRRRAWPRMAGMARASWLAAVAPPGGAAAPPSGSTLAVRQPVAARGSAPGGTPRPERRIWPATGRCAARWSRSRSGRAVVAHCARPIAAPAPIRPSRAVAAGLEAGHGAGITIAARLASGWPRRRRSDRVRRCLQELRLALDH